MSEQNRLDEMSARLRRIETRQMIIALAQGIDPIAYKQRFTLLDMLPPTMEVSGLDASLGNLLDFCKATCKTGGISGTVRLLFKGEIVATIEVPTEI